jgi:hypothetical protein
MAVSDTRPPVHQHPELAKAHNGPLTALHPKLAHNPLPQPKQSARVGRKARTLSAPTPSPPVAAQPGGYGPTPGEPQELMAAVDHRPEPAAGKHPSLPSEESTQPP